MRWVTGKKILNYTSKCFKGKEPELNIANEVYLKGLLNFNPELTKVFKICKGNLHVQRNLRI